MGRDDVRLHWMTTDAPSMDTWILRFDVPIDQDVEVVEYVAPGTDTTYEKYTTAVWVDEELTNLVPHRLKAWYMDGEEVNMGLLPTSVWLYSFFTTSRQSVSITISCDLLSSRKDRACSKACSSVCSDKIAGTVLAKPSSKDPASFLRIPETAPVAASSRRLRSRGRGEGDALLFQLLDHRRGMLVELSTVALQSFTCYQRWGYVYLQWRG
ncbi:uncharacterized protein LOC130136046 [Syzygium oleosum]|uniref:uncharacterized protein LOC130136046 n=1 Tax=Syzygium oleosum TaxID=219896 RepID=UPI0024BA6D79|nr:uncharacterized protein LOC130136046 [Syzygium oleosum]